MKNAEKKEYQSHEIKTKDDWNICLYRYEGKNKKRHPVFLVHGLASNRYNFDFPGKGKSFAQYLWKEGWDVWMIELRGSGNSRKKESWAWLKQKWNVDHYIQQDLPCAVNYILKTCGKKKLHWIGHSLGGLLVYPYITTQSSKIFQSITTIGSPINAETPPSYFKWTAKLDPLLKLIPFLPYRGLAKLMEKFSHRLHNMKEPLLFVKENMDAETLKICCDIAVDDVSSGVIQQLHRWIKKNNLKSFDESVDYTIDLKKLHTPLLMVTGNQDPFTPQSLVKKSFDEIASTQKKWMVFGQHEGHKSDYGHLDLIIGKNAPREVFPEILKWIGKHDA